MGTHVGNSCGWHVDWHDNRQISKVCKKQVNWNTILIKSVAGQTIQSTQKYVFKECSNKSGLIICTELTSLIL